MVADADLLKDGAADVEDADVVGLKANVWLQGGTFAGIRRRYQLLGSTGYLEKVVALYAGKRDVNVLWLNSDDSADSGGHLEV